MTDLRPKSKARAHSITVRISGAGVEAIDSYRSGWSRSEYVRQALTDAVKAGKRGPKVSDL